MKIYQVIRYETEPYEYTEYNEGFYILKEHAEVRRDRVECTIDKQEVYPCAIRIDTFEIEDSYFLKNIKQ